MSRYKKMFKTFDNKLAGKWNTPTGHICTLRTGMPSFLGLTEPINPGLDKETLKALYDVARKHGCNLEIECSDSPNSRVVFKKA